MGHCQLLPPGRLEEEHENYFFQLKIASIKNLFWTILVSKIMSSFNSGCKCPSLLSVQVCYLITGLSEILQTSLLHLRKAFLEKCYCVLEPYYMVLRLFSLIVPSSHVITTPVYGIRKSSGWYAFR